MKARRGKQKKTKKLQAQGKRYYDYKLLFVIVFLSCFGLVMVYSASYYTGLLQNPPDALKFVKRQAEAMLAGAVIMIVISRIDYHRLMKAAPFAYVSSIILMLLVNFTSFGFEVNGKKRWFGIKIGSHKISLFQPTEYVKLALIITFAYVIVKVLKKIDRGKTAAFLFVLAAIPGALVMKNNLSSGIIIFLIVYIMYFVASRKKKKFAILTGAVVGGGALAVVLGEWLVKINVLQAYQLSRINVWLDPASSASNEGYQVMQGLYAIGSGGLFGKGLGNSIQKLGFVPEASNDMIFSIICEELGFFGAVCVIVLFVFLIYRFLIIALNAPDLTGALLVTGVMAHISVQVVLNIAVVTNVIPNTGVTLPFISYGGSSMLFLMTEMGIVLGVSNQIVFENEQVPVPGAKKNEQS